MSQVVVIKKENEGYSEVDLSVAISGYPTTGTHGKQKMT